MDMIAMLNGFGYGYGLGAIAAPDLLALSDEEVNAMLDAAKKKAAFGNYSGADLKAAQEVIQQEVYRRSWRASVIKRIAEGKFDDDFIEGVFKAAQAGKTFEDLKLNQVVWAADIWAAEYAKRRKAKMLKIAGGLAAVAAVIWFLRRK